MTNSSPGGAQRKVKTAQRDAYKLTLKMLESLDRASPAEVAQYKGAAAAAAADFIKSPDAFQFDMAATPAVQQLQGDSQHGPLFQLLQLLLSGSVQVRNNAQVYSNAHHRNCTSTEQTEQKPSLHLY